MEFAFARINGLYEYFHPHSGVEMETDSYELPSERILQGPEGVRIAVPYKPKHTRTDYQRDFPPFDPPLVWVSNFQGLYQEILRSREIVVDDRTYRFSETQMNWLDSQRETVKQMLKDQGSP